MYLPHGYFWSFREDQTWGLQSRANPAQRLHGEWTHSPPVAEPCFRWKTQKILSTRILDVRLSKYWWCFLVWGGGELDWANLRFSKYAYLADEIYGDFLRSTAILWAIMRTTESFCLIWGYVLYTLTCIRFCCRWRAPRTLTHAQTFSIYLARTMTAPVLSTQCCDAQETMNVWHLLNERERQLVRQLDLDYAHKFQQDPATNENLIYFLGDRYEYCRTWNAVSNSIPTYRTNTGKYLARSKMVFLVYSRQTGFSRLAGVARDCQRARYNRFFRPWTWNVPTFSPAIQCTSRVHQLYFCLDSVASARLISEGYDILYMYGEKGQPCLER